MKLPNNKIIYLGVFIVLIITVVISYNEYKKNIPDRNLRTENVESIKPTIVVENNYQNADSDADGLSDWEEMLWKTDPKKKDSDSDGTSDGEEVALSRDPLKKGPNDKYNESSALIQNYTPTFVTDFNSYTSRIAREIYAKSQGSTDTDEAAKEIIEQIKNELQLSDIYKESNLITFDQSDKKKMEKYSQVLIEIQVDEIQRAVSETNNPYIYSDIYKQIAVKLSAIEVPKNFSGLHTNYVNNYNKLSVMAKRIADGEKDPAIVLFVLPEYTQLSQEQSMIIEQIKNYYKNNDIIFIKENA